jgi:hypothetical protein
MRWQYRIMSIGMFSAGQTMGAALSYFGRNGWELVTMYDKASNWLQGTENGFMLFKRAVPDGAEPEGAWCELWTPEHLAAVFEDQRSG